MSFVARHKTEVFMPKNQVTAEEISQAIIHRIVTGHYGPGDRLPSVRALASELGGDRNTVNKAYQMLADMGIIESQPSGRKGYSLKKIVQFDQKSKNELMDYFYQQSVNLVWQGMAAGIVYEEMLKQLTTAIRDVYEQSDVRLVFLECNQQDSSDMGHNLDEVLGRRVVTGILDDFYCNMAAILLKFDLIITTFHHLAEVIGVIKQIGENTEKVVGIETRPTPETMLGIARLPHTKIGLVTTLENTSHMLKHIISSYHPDRVVQAVTFDSIEAVKNLVQNSPYLVVTHTCAAGVTELTGREPDVVVNFQIEEQSISFLIERITDIQMKKTAPLHVFSASTT